MRIFVTGAAGFIGSRLCDALLKVGHTVYGLDNLVGGDINNVPRKITSFYEMSCRRIEYLPPQIDVVVHCAALPHEGLSVFSPKYITDSIYGASVSVFSAAIREKVKRIVFLSSMARFGNNPTPFTEDMSPKPQDPYAIAKVAAEQTLKCLCEAHGVEYVIAVPHSVIGPRQRLCDPFRNVIAIWMNRIMQGKQPIIYGDGQQRRNFSYIDDVIPSLERLATEGQVMGADIFNLGPDEETVTINHACKLVREAMGEPDIKPVYRPARPNEVEDAWCSSELARRVLGYETKTSLRDGIAKMAAWAKKVGPKPFDYFLPIEIVNERTPKVWTEQEI